jgi:hypothetical protein
MDSELPVQYDNLSWPDPASGPYRIGARFRVGAEEFELVGFAVSLMAGAEAGRLETSLLSKLPLIIEQVAAKLRCKLAEQTLPPAPSTPQSHLAYRERLLLLRRAEEAAEAALPNREGRPRTSLSELQAAATIYTRAYRRGQAPLRAVAEAQKITYAAASRRISHCRKIGLLGPVRQGQQGGGVLLRRGDARSLAAEIARLKISERRLQGRTLPRPSWMRAPLPVAKENRPQPAWMTVVDRLRASRGSTEPS